MICAYLSFTLLVGLGANALFGWWWADPAAALAMLPLILKEGLEALRGEACIGDPRLCGCTCCVPDCRSIVCVCEACLCC